MNENLLLILDLITLFVCALEFGFGIYFSLRKFTPDKYCLYGWIILTTLGTGLVTFMLFFMIVCRRKHGRDNRISDLIEMILIFWGIAIYSSKQTYPTPAKVYFFVTFWLLVIRAIWNAGIALYERLHTQNFQSLEGQKIQDEIDVLRGNDMETLDLRNSI
jgi:hypothetical protein